MAKFTVKMGYKKETHNTIVYEETEISADDGSEVPESLIPTLYIRKEGFDGGKPKKTITVRITI